jgi:carboxylesterase
MTSDNSPSEEGRWYRFRPQETLKQLSNLIGKVRKDLQKGFNLPTGNQMKVYKSTHDSSADPVSAVLIYKGLKNSDGSNIEVDMIDSKLHVATRLDGRETVTEQDRIIQTNVFDDMISVLGQ